MVFLIDKYNIQRLSDIICHKNIYATLFNKNHSILDKWNQIGFIPSNTMYPDLSNVEEKVLQCNDIAELTDLIHLTHDNFGINDKSFAERYAQLPNLLIYGPLGSGKKTLIKLLLADIYNESIYKTSKVTYQITGYGNSYANVEIEQSNYHIIIEPNNSGFDKYLIQEIVKEYAQQTIINVNECKTPFRIVFINNIDNLSYYAQTSLRCTMEKYHKTCKFILCGYQISKIIEPLRSRCLNVRVPSPPANELNLILFDISCKENIDIDLPNINNIVKHADGNIKKAIWMLQLYLSNITDYELSWKKSLIRIINIICNFEKNPCHNNYNSSHIIEIRNILYTIFITNINGNQIILELINGLFNNIKQFNPKLFAIIVQSFGYFETRINKGKRSIIHLEALINSIFYHILKFKLDNP